VPDGLLSLWRFFWLYKSWIFYVSK
jgi:hypothetical protein